MSHEVTCLKLNKQAPGLNAAPFPGPLGERIYQHISKEAFDAWINHQTMLINEYRLNPAEPEARAFLMKSLKQFLFNESEEN